MNKNINDTFFMPKTTMTEFCNDRERRCESFMDYKENYAMSQMVAKYFNVSFSFVVIRIKQLHLNFRDEKSFRCGQRSFCLC
jgi:hypothetical protein